MSWKIIALSDCCEIVSGSTPDTNIKEFWDGEIYWATPKDLSSLTSPFIHTTPRKITELGHQNCSARILPVNSVLFSSRAPIGHVAINTVPMCTNQGFKSFVPNPNKVDSKYLFYWLKANVQIFENLGNGATFKEVSKASVSKVQIPLPPLAEQMRIAEVLDKADALREKRRRALQKLDTLLQSVFLEMFGDPVRNPKGWDVKPFGTLVKNEDSKRIPVKSSDREILDGEYPYYGASGIIDYVDDYIYDGKRLLIGEDGANLLARSTPIAFIAEGKYWVNNHAHVVAYCGKAELEFLEVLFSLIDISPFVTGSAQPKLNRSNLDKISIIHPPIEMQKHFVNFYKERLVTRNKLEKAKQSIENLFKSLQQKAFKGELFNGNTMVDLPDENKVWQQTSLF